MNTAMPDDSGRRSLMGFFYQALQTAGLVVELYEQLMKDSPNDGIETRTVVRPEEQGNDAYGVATNGQTTVGRVIQHKFSDTPEAHPIEPGELFGILQKLREAADRISSKHGFDPELCLHTNRPFSENAQKDYDSVHGGPARKSNATKQLTVLNNEQYKSLLTKLNFDSKLLDDAKRVLERRANLFGVLPDELEERLFTIEGRYFAGVSLNATRVIRLKDLDRWLTKDESPRAISSSTTTVAIRAELNHLGAYLREFHPLLNRDVAPSLDTALNDPIVLITGDGGVGKSALVYQHFLSRLEDPPPLFLSSRHITNVSSNWCGQLFRTWRNSLDSNLENAGTDIILERLRLSVSSQKRPLLLLWLDGVDEADSSATVSALSPLLSYLRQERIRCKQQLDTPEIQLFVTCRSPRDFIDQFEEESQFGERPQIHCSVEVEEYSNAELSQVTDSFVSPIVVARIRKILAELAQSSANSPEDNMLPTVTVSQVDREWLAALRHPPFLAAVRKLSEQHIKPFVSGVSAGKREAARLYLTWFALKVKRRRWFDDEAEVLHMLESVRKKTVDWLKMYNLDTDWTRTIQDSGWTELQARRIHRECVSAGLIKDHGQRRWQWRNEYVCSGILAHSAAEQELST